MEERYVWKIQYRTLEKDEDGDELSEVENVISDSFDNVYQYAAAKVKGTDTVKWGYTGIVLIKCVSDKLTVI
jgi:hypothetical protein